jgi:hypothetical protein
VSLCSARIIRRHRCPYASSARIIRRHRCPYASSARIIRRHRCPYASSARIIISALHHTALLLFHHTALLLFHHTALLLFLHSLHHSAVINPTNRGPCRWKRTNSSCCRARHWWRNLSPLLQQKVTYRSVIRGNRHRLSGAHWRHRHTRTLRRNTLCVCSGLCIC